MKRTFVYCPLFRTIEEALAWFEGQDVDLETVRIWRGPDGLVRGAGEVRA